MRKKLYMLAWAQWRQQGLVLGAIWAFTVGIFFIAAYVDSNTLIYVDDELFIYPSILLWFAGIILIFTEQNAVGLHFHFPGRLATLPIRTSLLLGTTLFYRILLTTTHTLLCFFYLFMNSYRWSIWTVNLLLFSVVLAFSLQWATFLQVRNDTSVTVGKMIVWFVSLIVICAFVTTPIVDASLRVAAALVIITLPLAALCIHAGYDARHGSGTRTNNALMKHLPRKTAGAPRKGLLQKLPATPIWTQVWFECRDVTLWLPIFLVTATLLVLMPLTILTDMEFDVYESPIGGLGLGIAFTVGFLWEFTGRKSTRFLLAVPLAEDGIKQARLWAAAIATALALTGIMGILGAALAFRAAAGAPLLPEGVAMPYLFALVVATAPVWFVALTCGRVICLTLLPLIPILIALQSIFTFEDNSEWWSISAIFLVPPVTIFILGALAHKRCSVPLPWAWISLASLAVLVPLLSLYTSVENHLLLQANVGLVHLVLSALILMATLHYARSASLISKTQRNGLVVAFAVIAPSLAYVLDDLPYNAGLVDSDTAFYLTMTLMCPIIWLPLLYRMQRNA